LFLMNAIYIGSKAAIANYLGIITFVRFCLIYLRIGFLFLS
jgi:hypothetical protein